MNDEAGNKMKYLLLIATAVFVLSFGVVYAASPSAPLTVTVTPSQSSGGGGNGGALPGSILPPCPGGCTWSVAFDEEFNGNGSPGNLATDGINWNVWHIEYGEGIPLTAIPARLGRS